MQVFVIFSYIAAIPKACKNICLESFSFTLFRVILCRVI